MPPGLPANAPAGATTLYWEVLAVGLALLALAGLGWTLYMRIRSDLTKLRATNHDIASKVTVAAGVAQLNSRKLDDIHGHVCGAEQSTQEASTGEATAPIVGQPNDHPTIRPDNP